VRTVLSFPHRFTLLAFDTGQPYDRFRSRYEAAVPPADLPQLRGCGRRHAQWPHTGTGAADYGVHGFVLHWRASVSPLMTPAGECRPRTAYLMGSDAISETIYRQNPGVMLYSPFRALIYVDGDDRTYFAVQQPSTLLAGLTDPDLADLGARLDRQLADLLEALGIQADERLHSAGQASARAVSGGDVRAHGLVSNRDL
jgi:hypothetical protein